MQGFFNFSPKIEKVGSYYTVSGINVKAFEHDLSSNFGTSVIFSRLITRTSSRSFKIHQFFMIEFTWLIHHLTNQSNKRVVDRYYVGMHKYKQLYDEIKTQTWVESTFRTFPSHDVNKALKKFTITPYPDQRDFLDNYNGIREGFKLRGCLLDAAVGSGKAQPLDAKIKIPGGWTTMGEIKPGDTVVGGDGLPTTVLAIFPQGEQDIYQFTTSDGRKAEATSDHLWNIWKPHKHGGEWVQMTTAEIIAKREKGGQFSRQTYIPMVEPETTPHVELPIDPWALGALIGDGGMSGGDIRFSTSDEFILGKLKDRLGSDFLITKRKHGTYDYSITSMSRDATPQTALRELYLMGKLSVDKEIPDIYMNASQEQKWELIRGLMDTDGSTEITKKNGAFVANGTPTFNTSSEVLAKQFQELIWSLGGYAKITSRIPKYKHNGEVLEGKRAYRVWVRIGKPRRCFSLPRQVERVAVETQYSKTLKVRIEDISLVRRAPAQCIKVDNKDHLYVTNDYVVTHNTPTSLIWAEMISDGAIFVIVPKGLVDNPWKEEINKLYKNPPKVWSTLDGTDIMDHLDAKIFIIHKEQIRTGEWDLAIKTITKSGRNPAKVIVDESHNYNVHTSSQSKGLASFCKNPFISDVLMMSGTPIKAQGKETFTLFNIIDPMFDEAVHSQFLKLYGRDNTYLNEMLAHRLGRIKYTISAITNMDSPPEPIIVKVKFPGAENFTLDAIRAEMAMFITDRVRFYASMADEHLEDWTSIVNAYRQAVVHDKVNIEKLRKYLEIVNKFRTKGFDNSTDGPLSKFANEFEREMEQTVGMTGEQRKYWRHIKSAVKYVNLKIRGEALGNVLGKARMEAVRLTIAHADLPKYINAVKKKTLVYTSYVDVVHEVVSYLETQGMIASPLYGENTNEINTIINEFTNRPEINPLVTTFNTLREGRQMTMANQILLMNSPFRSYELVQTIARIYRRGQDEECFVYLFDLDTGKEENITSRSIDIMQWSEELVNQLMGGGKIPGLKQLNQNPIAFGGFESGMVWDVPTLDKDLEVDLELTVKRAMPIFKRANILDIF